MEHPQEVAENDQLFQIRQSLFKMNMFDDEDDDNDDDQKEESYARERLEMEMKEINVNPPTHISYGPVDSDDLFNWEGTITGALNSPYEGGIFSVSLKFPLDYPFNPPTVNFITKVYHPCIDEKDGRIDMDILKENWSPALTIEKVMLSIASFLSHPDVTDVDSDNYIARLYLNDMKSFRENARKWTFKYATP